MGTGGYTGGLSGQHLPYLSRSIVRVRSTFNSACGRAASSYSAPRSGVIAVASLLGGLLVRDALIWEALFGSGVRMLCSDVYPEHLPCRFTPTRYLLIDESGVSTLAGSSGGKVPPRGREEKGKGPDFSEAFRCQHHVL